MFLGQNYISNCYSSDRAKGMAKMGIKIIDNNKKAYFDYFIEDTYEAGVVLAGSEVKSIKAGNINLRDSFCFITKGEVWLKNCQVTPYEKGSAFNEEAKRDRKLLLNKNEINKLIGKIQEKGYTLIPLKVYLKNSLVKLEIGLGKGKQLHDKRDTLKDRDNKRDMERAIRDYK